MVPEGVAAIVAAAVAGIVGAPVIAGLRRLFGGEDSRVRLKLKDQVIELDLDRRLPPDVAQTLIDAAVRSGKAKDQAGVQDAVAASHRESEKVRGAA